MWTPAGINPYGWSVRASAVTALLAVLACGETALGQVTLTEGSDINVDVSADGRIVMDLLGGVWLLPPGGGNADAIDAGLLPAERPRWSPDAAAIVFEARSEQRSGLYLYHFANNEARALGDGLFSDRQPEWHPDGERIVFTSQRHDTGFDLWELDVSTGVSWRLTSLPGDESEPAWSADGRNLVYISYHDNRWSLVLRPFGQADRVLITTEDRLSAPSWRPDGSLVTFARENAEGLTINMLILSDPLLERVLIDDTGLFPAPVAWRDRQQMLFAADGRIRTRQFNSWVSRTVPFRATVGRPVAHTPRSRPVRELELIDQPDGNLVVRAARLFDGTGGGYRERLDILIEGGRIVAIEPQQDRTGAVVVDMGDLTVLPGFIDGYASLPAGADETLGPALLACGVTTLVADYGEAEALSRRWSGAEFPGPRILEARPAAELADPVPWLVTVAGDMNSGMEQRAVVERWQQQGVPVLAETWQAALGSGASLLLGAAALPGSPGSHQYRDMKLAAGSSEPVTIVSGLADVQTPNLDALLASRQGRLLGAESVAVRRFAEPPRLETGKMTVVLGSKPSGLPAGLGLHAEFRALAAAGLTPEQALRAAGVNAASALGVGLQLGRVAVGRLADLVIVDGDPLADVDDALNVVGVVRNGRFFSTIGLIDRIVEPPSVELFDKPRKKSGWRRAPL
jgi:hypothetical protein